jgi:hypothetical protein
MPTSENGQGSIAIAYYGSFLRSFDHDHKPAKEEKIVHKTLLDIKLPVPPILNDYMYV